MVPECMYFVLGEAKTICLELVDELIKKVADYHTLEGFLLVNEVYKARPKYPIKAYPNMGTRFLFEQDKLKVLKERNASNRNIKNNKKEIGKFPEYKNRIMKDKDVISVGTNNANTNVFNSNNNFDNKSVISKGTHKSKVYNFFDKKSEMEFLKEEDD